MAKSIVSLQQLFVSQAILIDSQTTNGFADMATKISSLFINPPTQAKAAKFALASYLAKFWIIFRCMERKASRLPRKLTSGLESVMKIMGKVEEACLIDNSCDVNMNKNKKLKSQVLSGEEKKRKFLEGNGIKPPIGFENCAMCGHCYVDQPPTNKANQDENKKAYTQHERLCKQWDDYKYGKRLLPPINEKGKQFTKRPAAPKSLHDIIRCHCIEFSFSHYELHSNCPINCIDNQTNLKYGQGQCPICNCSCMFACRVIDYSSIVAENALQKQKGMVAQMSKRDEANHWFNCAMNAGALARESSQVILSEKRKKGELDCDNDELEEYVNECASHATAQHLVRNKHSRGAIEATRQSIRSIQHPDGKTLIERNGEVVDLRNNASVARCKNNKLMRPVDIVIAIDDDSAETRLNSKANGTKMGLADQAK